MSQQTLNIEKTILQCQALCQIELLDNSRNISNEQKIRDIVTKVCAFQEYSYTEKEKEYILRTLFESMYVQMDDGIAVINHSTYKPWLDSRRSEIDPFYWERYRRYLIAKGWTPQVVTKMGTEADKILDLLGNPSDIGSWKRRGLIMGDVQSGKTANYTSICNKAMDAGYRVIIVLTGTQEGLRKQTQERLDQELVGLASEQFLAKTTSNSQIGVGKLDRRHFVATFTSKTNDFDQKLLDNLRMRISSCSEPVLFVVKKQKNRLNYLYRWLRAQNTQDDGYINEPLLLIDDEADNASVNTKTEEKPTTINQCIRQLLSLFHRFSYVGVTATPFANIFIDPEHQIDEIDDLFPKDFIYSLTAPSNYIGANAYFGEGATKSNQVIIFEDMESALPLKHKKEHEFDGLPKSLQQALGYFLLVNAIMDSRIQSPKHRSMLVHISRLIALHTQIEDAIQLWVDGIKRDVLNYGGLSESEACEVATISFLREVWHNFGLSAMCPIPWETLQQQYLNRAIAPVKVLIVNSTTASLDYNLHAQNGLRVIAIGGNGLSRGLTLEGLCVSYFYRNSRAYDTLMQMGRWFGYRPGYDDLCRIWMTDEARDSYTHITTALDELRDEIFDMRRNNLTPLDYGLMVRSHPESVPTIVGRLIATKKGTMVERLTVTAKNKMQAAAEYVHTVSASGKLMETPRLPSDTKLLQENHENISRFISKLDKYEVIAPDDPTTFVGPSHLVWRGIPGYEVAALIASFRVDPLYLNFQGDNLAEYIQRAPHLTTWDVAIPSGESDTIKIGNHSIKPQKRFTDTGRNGGVVRINGNRSRVGSRPCTIDGLDRMVRDQVFAESKTKRPSDKDFLTIGRNPLLLLHIVEIDARSDIYANQIKDQLTIKGINLTAIGLGFPKVLNEPEHEKVTYIINKVKLQQLQDAYDDGEDDDYEAE